MSAVEAVVSKISTCYKMTISRIPSWDQEMFLCWRGAEGKPLKLHSIGLVGALSKESVYVRLHQWVEAKKYSTTMVIPIAVYATASGDDIIVAAYNPASGMMFHAKLSTEGVAAIQIPTSEFTTVK